jgi:hypothetical protein
MVLFTSYNETVLQCVYNKRSKWFRPGYKVWPAPEEKLRVPHHFGSTSHGGNREEGLLTVQFRSVVHFLKR